MGASPIAFSNLVELVERWTGVMQDHPIPLGALVHPVSRSTAGAVGAQLPRPPHRPVTAAAEQLGVSPGPLASR